MAELRDWLAGRGCEGEQITAAIDRLAAVGELDDRRFAVRYAEDKRELRGWGPDRIRTALLARGIEPDDVEAALRDDGHEGQVERAAALLGERGIVLDGERERARAFGLLARRGFDHEVAYAAIRRAKQAQRRETHGMRE